MAEWTSDELIWYVAHTRSRQEELANNSLMMAGFKTLLLRYWRTITHARKTTHELRPFYPRYIFVGVRPNQHLFDVNEALGVSTVLYGCDGPHALGENAMADLRRMANPGGTIHSWAEKETKETVARYQPGDRVRISFGPFTGLTAVVGLDKGKQVDLILDINSVKLVVSAGSLLAETASP